MIDKLVKQAANDNMQRPREFDARLEAYLPGLRKLARKYRRDRDEQDELVNETVAQMCSKWRNFREDGGFWMWAVNMMRGVVSNQQIARTRLKRTADTISINADNDNDIYIPFDAHHDQIVDADRLIAEIKGRDGEMLVRRAMGETLADIGARYGVSKERVRQLTERERKRVLKVVGA